MVTRITFFFLGKVLDAITGKVTKKKVKDKQLLTCMTFFLTWEFVKLIVLPFFIEINEIHNNIKFTLGFQIIRPSNIKFTGNPIKETT